MSPLTELHDWLVSRRLIDDGIDTNRQIVRMWAFVEDQGVAIFPNNEHGPRYLAAYYNSEPVAGPTMLVAALRAIKTKLEQP